MHEQPLRATNLQRRTVKGPWRSKGLHHITAITADAPRNVDFYARVLGLRLVKKTVNFDQPDVYHLYYGDEAGTPGSILTFFEFPDAAPRPRGDGMVHAIVWRVAGPDALGFWAQRLADEGTAVTWVEGGVLRFQRPRGPDARARRLRRRRPAAGRAGARHPAREHALLGFHGVRAYAQRAGAQRARC